MAKAWKNFLLGFTALLFFLLGTLPNTSQAAGFLFSPSSGTGTVGVPLTVTAILNTNGVIANAADASISFPPSLLNVSSVSKTGSVMALWILDPTFSNSTGEITFTGGTPRPGFSGSSLTLATITFIPKAAGTATISFTGVSVLSGDGLATELLNSLGSATFVINAAPPPPPPPPPVVVVPPPAPPPVIIYVPVPAVTPPAPPPAPPAPPPEPVVCPPTGTGYVPPSTIPTEPPIAPIEIPAPPTVAELVNLVPTSIPELITTPAQISASFDSAATAMSNIVGKTITRFLQPAPVAPIVDKQGNLQCPAASAITITPPSDGGWLAYLIAGLAGIIIGYLLRELIEKKKKRKELKAKPTQPKIVPPPKPPYIPFPPR